MIFFGDLKEVLAILIRLSVYVIYCVTLIQFFKTKMCLPGQYHLLRLHRIYTNLHSRGHNFQLRDYYCSALHKRSFVIRTLFQFV